MLSLFAADIADVPDSFWKYFSIAFMVVGGVLLTLWKATRPAPPPTHIPQPMITREQEEWATAAGVKELARKVDENERRAEAKIAELHAALNGLREHFTQSLNSAVQTIAGNGESRVIKIHDRIEPLSQCVHDLAGRFSELSRLVHDILNRLPAGQRKG